MSPSTPSPAAPPPAEPAHTAPPKRVVAVMDIGSTAVRMELAEIGPTGEVRTLDALQKPVHLGKDTFARGRIQQSTIEECVEILRGFRRVMEEYGVTDPSQVRAVATSSVREATNRDTFLDRIYMATRINVEAIEEAEETRLTYMAVQDILHREPDLQKGDALVVEVGGGDSEFLLVQDGHVTFSNTFRLGALRMREALDAHRAPDSKVPALLTKQIQLAVDQIRRSIPASRVPNLVAISGDARFAASQLSSKWADQYMVRLDVKAFSSFAKKIAPLSMDEIVKNYRTTYQDAETVGPALMAYAQLAKVFQVENLLVPKSSLRHGLLQELAAGVPWTPEFSDQVVYSAVALGAKYAFDEKHARQVADLGVRLFRELQPEHQLGPRHELLLRIAALLHEIGSFISNRSHHKHSMYLILNSDLFGLSRHDMTLIALTARYHRRAVPQPYHEVYSTLSRDDRLAVSKMAAILRVADALDRNHMQQARDLACRRDKGQFTIGVNGIDDLALERLALKEKGAMFEEVYGLQPVLRSDSAPEGIPGNA
jgi:exopolyphosphatase/guanosine-5'-triphosphate,3'-diphosphate pyrophosphatase